MSHSNEQTLAAEQGFIRDAATILLVHPIPNGKYQNFQVYTIRRSDKMKSFAGVWAFPGGSVDPQDRIPEWEEMLQPLNVQKATEMAVYRENHKHAVETLEFREMMKPIIEKRIGRPIPEDPIPESSLHPEDNLAVWATALRELFEETGALLVKNKEALPDTRVLQEARRALRADDISFMGLLSRYKLQPDAEALRYMGRLLTPSTNPRRFDTRFFLARYPQNEDVEGIRGALEEAVEEGWFEPKEMLSNESGRFTIIPPTRYVLTKVAGFDSIETLWEAFSYQS